MYGFSLIKCDYLDRRVDLISESMGTWRRYLAPGTHGDSSLQYPGRSESCSKESLPNAFAFDFFFETDSSVRIKDVEVETCDESQTTGKNNCLQLFIHMSSYVMPSFLEDGIIRIGVQVAPVGQKYFIPCKLDRKHVSDGITSKWDCEREEPTSVMSFYWLSHEAGLKLKGLKASFAPGSIILEL